MGSEHVTRVSNAGRRPYDETSPRGATSSVEPYQGTTVWVGDTLLDDTMKYHDEVIERERLMMFLVAQLLPYSDLDTWRPLGPICAAPLIDPVCGPCGGRTTIDHIKEWPRMGVRAASDMDHMVALCENHTENGARGGRQWNTGHRPDLRLYLRLANYVAHVDDPDR